MEIKHTGEVIAHTGIETKFLPPRIGPRSRTLLGQEGRAVDLKVGPIHPTETLVVASTPLQLQAKQRL